MNKPVYVRLSILELSKILMYECVIKRKLKFENYKNCLEATQLENKIHYLDKK